MKKSEMRNLVKAKYEKNKFKKDPICFGISKHVFDKIENGELKLDYFDLSILTAISVFNKSNPNSNGFETMPINIKILKEVLGIGNSSRKEILQDIFDCIVKLKKLNVIEVEYVGNEMASKDKRVKKNKDLIFSSKFIIRQSFKNEDGARFILIPQYAFDEIVLSKNKDSLKLKLVACYVAQAYRNYAPKKINNPVEGVDYNMSVTNKEPINKLGARYGFSRRVCYDHLKILFDMGLLVYYKVLYSYNKNKTYSYIMTQSHYLKHMQSSIEFQIKNGTIIGVEDELK